MKTIYFYTNVTLGYGNQNYLNLSIILCKSREVKVRFIEPLDIDRKYIALDSNLFVRSHFFLRLGGLIRSICPRLVTKAIFRILNLIYSWVYLIFLFVFRRPDSFIVAKYHPVVAFFSKFCSVSFYCTELFEVEGRKGFLYERFKKNVQCVMSAQEDRCAILRAVFNTDRIYLIQNCPLLSRYPRLAASRSSGLINVLYQGRIGKDSNADTLFEVIKLVSSDKVRFVLAGPVDDSYLGKLDSLIRENVNVSYHGYVSSKELDSLRADCDVGLVTWGNDSPNTKYCAPNKLYEYIAQGMYVVSFDNYSMRKLNKEYNFGYVQESGGGVRLLVELLNNLDANKISLLKGNNRRLFLSELNYECQSRDFVCWFESV